MATRLGGLARRAGRAWARSAYPGVVWLRSLLVALVDEESEHVLDPAWAKDVPCDWPDLDVDLAVRALVPRHEALMEALDARARAAGTGCET